MHHVDGYVIMKNGHRLYFKAGRAGFVGKNVIEAMPGTYSKTDTAKFTNHTKHWKMYFVKGYMNKTAKNDPGEDAQHIAEPVAGYKYLPDKGESISNLPNLAKTIGGDNYNTLYNSKKKILINAYQLGKEYGL